MNGAHDKALIVQSDSSVLLELNAQRADEARAALAPFTELVKSPDHVHTYRLTPLSIWNARAAGLDADEMIARLREHARYAVPPSVEQETSSLQGATGALSLHVMATLCAAVARMKSQRSAFGGAEGPDNI